MKERKNEIGGKRVKRMGKMQFFGVFVCDPVAAARKKNGSRVGSPFVFNIT